MASFWTRALRKWCFSTGLEMAVYWNVSPGIAATLIVGKLTWPLIVKKSAKDRTLK